MTALIASGAIKSGRKLIAAFTAFTAVFYLALNFGPDLSRFDTAIFHYLRNFIGERGRGLYFYFLGGTLLYHYRHKIPYSHYLFALCVALSLIRNLSFFGQWKDILFLFPVSYMTAYIGLLPIRRLPLFSRGDYSYGIYLYGYPLQQMLIQLHPRLPIALHSLFSIVLATGVAMLSWHCIEKPVLRLRRRFSFTAQKGEAHQTLPNTAQISGATALTAESPPPVRSEAA